MRTAVTTLALLLELVQEDSVAAAFLTPSLVHPSPLPPPSLPTHMR